jgi:hypothetical protein
MLPLIFASWIKRSKRSIDLSSTFDLRSKHSSSSFSGGGDFCSIFVGYHTQAHGLPTEAWLTQS